MIAFEQINALPLVLLKFADQRCELSSGQDGMMQERRGCYVPHLDWYSAGPR